VKSYRDIMRNLTAMTEAEVQRALDAEMASERRLAVVERLHQRLCILRARRERDELLKDVRTP
jgi:hypothetical protein